LVDVSGAGVPARDAAGGGKGRPATLDQDVDAGFAGRRAGTPAPLLNFPFTRLPWPGLRPNGNGEPPRMAVSMTTQGMTVIALD
jgi:hypothetical protein